MRSFLNKNVMMSYMFGVTQLKMNDLNQLLEKLKHYQSKNDFTQRQDVYLLGEQLKPYFHLMQPDDLLDTLDIFQTFQLIDINITTNIYQRGYFLFQEKQFSEDQYLNLVDFLLGPGKPTPPSLAEDAFTLISQMNIQALPLPQLILVLSIYGKLVAFFNQANALFEKQLSIQIKEYSQQLNSNQLGQITLSASLSQIKDIDLYKQLEQRGLKYFFISLTVHNLKGQLFFEDLIKVATGFQMSEKGSQNFWNIFQLYFVHCMGQLTPDKIGQTILLLNNAQKALYEKVEQVFLQKYCEFDCYNSLVVFACLAKQKLGSEDTWELFATDVASILQNTSVDDAAMLIEGTLNIFNRQKENAKQEIIQFIKSNGPKFQESKRDAIHGKMKELGLLDLELENALQLE